MNDRVTSEQEQAVMPSSVHKRLKWTMKQWTIQQVIAQMSKRGNSDDDLGRLLHPTDLFGDYVAWLWSDGRRQHPALRGAGARPRASRGGHTAAASRGNGGKLTAV
jgi:hypothetical protein